MSPAVEGTDTDGRTDGRTGGPSAHTPAAGGSRTPSVGSSGERRAHRAGHVTAAAPRGRSHAALATASALLWQPERGRRLTRAGRAGGQE